VAGVYSELRAFILAHRECVGLRRTDVQQPAVDGYRRAVICGCGVEFRRWVTLDETDEKLIRTTLLAFEN
jgi:hypothetical protein